MPQDIWLVDDNAHDRELARNALIESHLSNPIVEFGTCEEALDQLLVTGISPLLILLDLDFKGTMDGLTFLDRLRSNPATRNISVIVLTGTDTNLAETYARGVTAHLLKPVRAHRLLEAIRSTVLCWTITD